MEILPTTLGTRPGLACEIRPEGIVAARRGDAPSASIAALARCILPHGAFRSGLRPGNIVDRPAVIAAIREAFEKVVDRARVATLIVPDASARVLLLDFDALPAKPAEALPIVRFRLKKLLPFEADDAAISYQVMSSSRSIVRVVAIAMPREVLDEYESVVREAGFEPGAILPSTLAVLAGLDESEAPALLVNAGPDAVTAAIVRGGILLLHRSVDMRADMRADLPPASHLDAVTPTIPAELLASPPHDPIIAPQTLSEPLPAVAALEAPAHLPASEIVQAVSVAAAYFEDTLGTTPTALLAAGPTTAAHLSAMLRGTTLEAWPVQDAIPPASLPSGQGPAGMPGSIPRGWIAGVHGALRG